ncbi:hypothetical protein Tco_0659315 [Tanacetum coccineum]
MIALNRDSEIQAMEDLGVGSSDGVNKNKVDTSKCVSVKRRRTSAKNNLNSLVFETRSSPRTFYNSISTLKSNQKACLEHIGFGNFVEFRVDGIPAKLGLYVVDKFDDKKMEIKLAEGSLKITKNLISEMLGIRNEGINIMAEEGKRNEEMVSSWMKQYGNKKDITPCDIKLRIRESNSADMNFKLNFIILFTSVMGQIKTNGFCDLKILDYISPYTDMANINWCKYVLICLQSCKEEWTKGKKNYFFRGSLTYLTMAYVDGSKCNSFNVVRKRPPTLVWTSELLKEREDEELNSRGFRFGEIEGLFVEQEDPMPDNIEAIRICVEVKQGEVVYTTLLSTVYEVFCIRTFNANISDANRATDAQADGQNNEGASFFSVEAMMGEGVISLGDEHADIGMDQEETQEEVLRSVDDVDTEIERRKWCDMSHILSFSLGLTQEYAHLDQHVVTPVATTQEPNLPSEISNPVPLLVCPPVTAVGHLRCGKDKRPIPISKVRKSPFIGRVVDADGSLNAEEKRVTKYMFEVLEDHSVTLFETIFGQQSTRVQMQSLAQCEYVANNILDTWGSVLNHMEVYRSKESPFRIFLPTFGGKSIVYISY